MTSFPGPATTAWGLASAKHDQRLTREAERCRQAIASGAKGRLPMLAQVVHQEWKRLAEDLDSEAFDDSQAAMELWLRATAMGAGQDPDVLCETMRLGLAELPPQPMAAVVARLAQESAQAQPDCAAFLTAVVASIREALLGAGRACAIPGIGSWSLVTWKALPVISLPERSWVQFTPSRLLKQALTSTAKAMTLDADDEIIVVLAQHGYPPERSLGLCAALIRTMSGLLGQPRSALAISDLGILVRLDHAAVSAPNPKTGEMVSIPGSATVGFLPDAALRRRDSGAAR